MLVAQNSLGPVCPVPLTVRGTYGQVAKVAHPAIADGCREEFDSSRFFLEALLATTTYETFLGLMMTEARRVKDKRDSKLDTIDEDEEKSGHK